MPWWPTSVLDALTRIEGKIEGLNRKLDTKTAGGMGDLRAELLDAIHALNVGRMP